MGRPQRDTDNRASLLDRFIKDREGRLALAARPNLPIATWAVARILTWPLGGTAEHIARGIAFGGLFTWAWLELFQGVNYFRRALGLVVLVMLIASTARSGHL